MHFVYPWKDYINDDNSPETGQVSSHKFGLIGAQCYTGQLIQGNRRHPCLLLIKEVHLSNGLALPDHRIVTQWGKENVVPAPLNTREGG